MSSRLFEGSPPTVPYQLGAPIELADFLALPPDGHRYARDEEGRLALMTPDHYPSHRRPLAKLTRFLNRLLPDPYFVLHEGSIAFPHIYSLRGELVRESFFGPKTIEPDIAVFAHEPRTLPAPRGSEVAEPTGIRLVIEVVSSSTWRADLGLGRKDDVDRPRTYLESGVPEYWAINVGVDELGCPLRPRSGRFLERAEDGRSWRELPVVEGRVRSRSVPELDLDLEPFLRAAEA